MGDRFRYILFTAGSSLDKIHNGIRVRSCRSIVPLKAHLLPQLRPKSATLICRSGNYDPLLTYYNLGGNRSVVLGDQVQDLRYDFSYL